MRVLVLMRRFIEELLRSYGVRRRGGESKKKRSLEKEKPMEMRRRGANRSRIRSFQDLFQIMSFFLRFALVCMKIPLYCD
jgi:hypothetical protein